MRRRRGQSSAVVQGQTTNYFLHHCRQWRFAAGWAQQRCPLWLLFLLITVFLLVLFVLPYSPQPKQEERRRKEVLSAPRYLPCQKAAAKGPPQRR